MPNFVFETLASPSPCSLTSPPLCFCHRPHCRPWHQETMWIIFVDHLSCVQSRHLSLSGLSCAPSRLVSKIIYNKWGDPATPLPWNQMFTEQTLAGYSRKFTDDRYCNVKQRSSNVHPSRHVGGILGRAWEQHVNWRQSFVQLTTIFSPISFLRSATYY